jgi:hypothetical protein
MIIISPQRHLSHSHSWVRQAACRLWGVYFAARNPTLLLAADENSDFIAQAGRLFSLGKIFCEQLLAAGVDAAFGNQLLRNLLFVGRALLPAYLAEPPPARTHARQRRRERHQQELAENKTLLEEKASREKPEASGSASSSDSGGEVNESSSDSHDELEEVDSAAQPAARSGLGWLVKQVSYVARQEALNHASEAVRRECAFKWFAALATHIKTPEVVQRLLLPMVRALHRTEEDEHSPAGIKQLAAEVSGLLREVVGAAAFIQAHTTAATELAQTRGARKQKLAQAVITQPAVAMQRKMKKNLHKREVRKRKAFAEAGYLPKKRA